jgi:hypothetical protein
VGLATLGPCGRRQRLDIAEELRYHPGRMLNMTSEPTFTRTRNRVPSNPVNSPKTTIHIDMISTTTKTASVTLKAVEDQRMKVDGSDATFGDWRDDLARDGYAVIKGAIPKERADKYADQMYSWLEGL